MPHSRPSSRLVLVLVALGLLVGLVGCGGDEGDDTADGGSGDQAELAGVVRTPPLEVAQVKLPVAGSDEPPVAMKAPAGELLLAYFGYTSCPDICPTTLSDISVALGDLPPELADRVTVAMTTVDPDRDTAEVLTGYLGHFFDDSLPLRTEDPAALKAATDAFGVRFEVADHASGEDSYEVSHSAVTYVIDDTGTVVVEWPFGFESSDMTSDITKLLQEETP